MRSERGRVERDEKKDPPTQAPPRALSARGAMASWLSAFSSAYLPGDVVPMMRRTQHSGVRVHTEFFFRRVLLTRCAALSVFFIPQRRTAWHEVPHRASPRFLTDRRAKLEGAPADVPDAEPFKMCACKATQ